MEKILSVFIDESGDFGFIKDASKYYLITLVFHDQSIDISSNIEKIKDKPVFHAGPIIRREYPFQNESMEDRKKIFQTVFMFTMGLPIKCKSETVNNSFIKYYKEYLCVGGLPDAVNTFLLTKDLNQVYDIQIGILENYKDDFAKHLDEEEEKYVDKNELTKIMEVYNSIPSQLAKENKKFQYSKIDKKAKGREYRFAITWLEEFGLAKLCYNLNNIELPLEGNKNEECFKLYITDTGLFMAMLGNDTYNEILNKDMGIYKGAIYENIIAESFIKNGKNLYYFSKPSGLEIDFITKIKNEIVAVEVKSTNGNTKSLNELLKNDKYNVSNAIKLINGNIGQNNNIYTIPLYMSFLIGGQE